ncbi:hypothetical protein [Microscilla marina]|uniref:Uncharacterized protein n=1 Tax=Microscilla marina ATCC 23134 TaxID=313606 RepID=A1ZWG2_MICM2|nr:hypothetical protein [Microscilla marina]EAY25302.1 hypothetical protein M23134_02772 [Microscilla marina ATCC 23134]
MKYEVKEIAYNERLFKKLIKQALLKAPQQKHSIEDIVLATGLSTRWVAYTLSLLLRRYPCRFETNENNDLLYIFDFDAGENRLQRWFTQWLKTSPNTKGGWLRKTVAHIAGITDQLKDRWLTEKLILNYIRNNQGQIVIAELIQLTGWSIRQAETEAVQLLANYEGEVEITTQGVIIYKFAQFAKPSNESVDISESLKIWERPLAEKEWKGEDLEKKIKALNQWNFRIAATAPLVFGGLFYLLSGSVPTQVLLLSAGLPLSLSTLFYSIPAVRKLRLSLENEKIRRKNVERYVLKAIFHRIHQQIRPERQIKVLIDDVKPLKTYLYWWNSRLVDQSMFDVLMMLTCTYDKEAIFREKALALDAELNVDTSGEICYEFERLHLEITEVAHNRLPSSNSFDNLLI